MCVLLGWFKNTVEDEDAGVEAFRFRYSFLISLFVNVVTFVLLLALYQPVGSARRATPLPITAPVHGRTKYSQLP